jgi:two-component system, NtrC family, sensor histidine kinase AtoS
MKPTTLTVTHEAFFVMPAPIQNDVQALADAFQLFTETTQRMEEAYQRLQARVEELDQELAFTSDYLRNILESMSDGVIAVDLEGRITAFNSAATDILGFAAADVVGRPFQDVFDRDFAAHYGRPGYELRTRAGRPVLITERDAPIADKDKSEIGQVKVFQDLTQLEALREQVRHQDRLAAIGKMAATVAHEIRNPLGGIRGFAALLARDIAAGDPRARLVDRILVGVKQLDRVVSDLLEYTRPLELQMKPWPCAELVESAWGFVDPAGKTIAFEPRMHGDLLVHADADKLRQVFLNLLINAVQSIPDEGKIIVTALTSEHGVTIGVADSGCGIAPDQIDHIFSPFFTTREKGTGLGLAIASKIVEGHGGRLTVHSTPGAGSTFEVRLPRAGTS